MTGTKQKTAPDEIAQAIVDLMRERFEAEVESGAVLEALMLAGQRLCGPVFARQEFERCFVISS